MARLKVNPTRMELTRLKKKLRTARKGHKLLKDKRDELMKQFLELVRRNKILREKVERLMTDTYAHYTMAAAVMSPEYLEEALMYPNQTISIDIKSRNIMSVDVPVFVIDTQSDDPSNLYPYGFAFTSGELDTSIDGFSNVLPAMLELAEIEKAAQLLAIEIEKTRRRVNALEYVMIPQTEETIKFITMKLDENERGNLTRLMKVKDMMVKQQIEQNQL